MKQIAYLLTPIVFVVGWAFLCLVLFVGALGFFNLFT